MRLPAMRRMIRPEIEPARAKCRWSKVMRGLANVLGWAKLIFGRILRRQPVSRGRPEQMMAARNR